MTESVAAEVGKLKGRLRKVTIDGTEFFLAEGDLLLTEGELPAYAEAKLNPPVGSALEVGAGAKTSKLLVVSEDGKPLRWAPGVVLSYYIMKETFTAAQYVEVRANVVSATEEWMATCGVEFQHLVNLDDDATLRAQTAALFAVRFLDSGGRFIAAAFFPNDPAVRRRVLIDPSYFAPGLGFDKVGVLRHELGHVLGFRHEHIRSGAPAVCPGETLTDTIELTAYDPQSVMHYFCGNLGSTALAISDLDRQGARFLYGSSLADFTLASP